MDRYKTTFDTWNKVADLYQEKFMDLELYNNSYRMFCNKVEREDADILEIGCGPGNIMRYMLSIRQDFHFLATDVSPNMIRLAKANIPAAEVAVLDAREIGQLTKKFDGIIAGFCLPYLSKEDVSKLVRDAALLLHPGGCMYLSTIAGDYTKSGYRKGSTGDQTYVYFYNEAWLTEILLINGFSMPEIISLDYAKPQGITEQHLIFIAKKNN
ncbi:MAG: methyltransferase family protein [Ferruginibacter sp.]|nr:methyltransferase family protein [Ferruginibacter sp.]